MAVVTDKDVEEGYYVAESVCGSEEDPKGKIVGTRWLERRDRENRPYREERFILDYVGTSPDGKGVGVFERVVLAIHPRPEELNGRHYVGTMGSRTGRYDVGDEEDEEDEVILGECKSRSGMPLHILAHPENVVDVSRELGWDARGTFTLLQLAYRVETAADSQKESAAVA